MMNDRIRNERLLYTFLEIGCLLTLVICFFLTLFGIIDIRIVNDFNIPTWVNYIGYFLLFHINIYFYLKVAGKLSYSDALIFTIAYFPIYLISLIILGENLITSTIIVILYTLLIGYKIGKLTVKSCICRCLLIFILTALYQLMATTIKVCMFEFKFQVVENIYTAFIYSIDMYIFYYILIKKEVGNYVEDFLRKPFQFCINCREVLTTKQEVEDVSTLTTKQRYIFYILAGGWQLLLLAAVLAIGIFNLGLCETIIILFTFWISRKILVKTYHTSPGKCTLITITSFYVLTQLSLPFSVSLFTGIILSALTTFLFYKYQLSLEDKQQMIDTLKELNTSTKFDIDNATENEIIERCKKLKFKYLAETINFLVTHYIKNNRDVSKTAHELFMEEQSVKNKVCSLRQKLNS